MEAGEEEMSACQKQLFNRKKSAERGKTQRCLIFFRHVSITNYSEVAIRILNNIQMMDKGSLMACLIRLFTAFLGSLNFRLVVVS